jgi:hypothetical protein
MIGLAAVAAGCEARDRSLGTGTSIKCQQVPACQSQCPEGKVNPVDSDGCTHTCECVPASTADAGADAGTGTDSGTGADAGTRTADASTDAGTGNLKLYLPCGDPVCRGYTGGSGAALCTTETVGDACSVDGQRCDPQDPCNALVVCAATDPKTKAGSCPISRRRFKDDIHYLAPAELARYRDELLAMKLATWRYKHDPAKQRLGIMIDDNEASVAVDAQRDMVDLYGYTSLAVATIQLQARQIEALTREVAAMRKTLARSARPAAGDRRP